MTKQDAQEAMVELQFKMDALQVRESKAYQKKLDADKELTECQHAWFTLYTEYLKYRAELEKLK